MRIRTSVASLFLGASLLTLNGCAGYTQNVRAYRAYMYESPNLAVALDRTEDMAKVSELVDKLLLSTPYTPGDAWVQKLVLTDAGAKEIKDGIVQSSPYSDASFQVPVAKIYRVHLEKVLAEAPKEGKFPSLLDAVGSLADDAKDLRPHWEEQRTKVAAYVEADVEFERTYAKVYPKGKTQQGPEDPTVAAARQARDDAKDAMKKAQAAVEKDVEALRKTKGDNGGRGELIKDLTASVSVGYRANLEALALIPIVAVQIARSIPRLGSVVKEGETSPTEAAPGAFKGIKQLGEVPTYIDGIKERMSRQAAVLDIMTKALAAASQQTVEQTPGFAMKESVVDQVVGVTADSFRVNVKAGGEIFFFSSIKNQTDPAQQQASGQDQKITKNYDGRLRELRYEVKPIVLAAAKLDVGFDYIQLPNAGNLSLGYKTDRVYSSGGSVEAGSLSQQLGVKGVASDALDLGLGILGVKTAVRLATFTAGTVHYVNSATQQDVILPNGQPATGAFQIHYTQVDLGYDIAFLMGESAGRYFIEELTVGGRYFEYALPRIMYELENQTPENSDGRKNYTYFSESAPQLVTSKYYMGGVTARMGPGAAPPLGWFVDLGIYAGTGPSSYYMRKTKPTAQNVDSAAQTDLTNPNTQELQKKNAIAANVAIAAGARLRIAQPGSRVRISGEAQYRAELIYAQTSGSSDKSGDQAYKDHIVDFGATDVFHGPRISLVGEF